MIPYVEVIDKYTLKKYAIVEPNESWFELSFFEVGECEVYCRATEHNLKALKKGSYLKIPNKNYVWVITKIEYSFNSSGLRMITATGKEAKWLLNKRAILDPKELPTTFGGAIGLLLEDNTQGVRNLGKFGWRILDTTPIENTQATRGNLLDFILELGKTYKKGVQVIYEDEMLYLIIIDNKDLTSKIKFAQSHDNLISSSYYSTDEDKRNYALTVSKVEEEYYKKDYSSGAVGIDRSEIVVDSNISTKYTNEQGVETEVEPTSALYSEWLIDEAKKTLAEHTDIEEVNGEIDIANSNYEFAKDFFIGDIVKVQDEYFGYSFKTRILKFSMVQDSEGYKEEVDYGND